MTGPNEVQASRLERKKAVVTSCMPFSLARYVTWVGEPSKQAKDSSLMAIEACEQWHES